MRKFPLAMASGGGAHSIFIARYVFCAHTKPELPGQLRCQSWKQNAAAAAAVAAAVVSHSFSVSFLTWKRLLSSGIEIVRVTTIDGAFLNVIWPTLFRGTALRTHKINATEWKAKKKNNLCSGTAWTHYTHTRAHAKREKEWRETPEREQYTRTAHTLGEQWDYADWAHSAKDIII